MLCLCGQVKFPFWKQLVCEHIPALLQITMATYVFLAIVQYAIVTKIFDLRMLRSGYDTFALIINFINPSWVPCLVTIGLFEALDTSSATLAKQVKVLLAKFNLTNKIIVYGKDVGDNLNSFTTTLTFVVSCELLQLPQPFASFCFGHVMSKAC